MIITKTIITTISIIKSIDKNKLRQKNKSIGFPKVTDLWSFGERGYLRGKGIESPFPLSVLSFGAFLFTQKKSGIGRHYNLRQELPKRTCSSKSNKKTTILSYLFNTIKHNSCLQGTPLVGSLRYNSPPDCFTYPPAFSKQFFLGLCPNPQAFKKA